MDQSKLYISMCEQAKQIQQSKKQHYFGDFIFHDGNIKVVSGYCLNEQCNEYRVVWNIDCTFNEMWFTEGLSDTTWLPRMDQLMQMLFQYDAVKFGSTFTRFDIVCYYNGKGEQFEVKDDEGFKAATFEQYLLLNVMFFLYDSEWVFDDKEKEIGHWQVK